MDWIEKFFAGLIGLFLIALLFFLGLAIKGYFDCRADGYPTYYCMNYKAVDLGS